MDGGTPALASSEILHNSTVAIPCFLFGVT